LFTEKQPRKNSDYRYVWLCESQRLNTMPQDESNQKKVWPQTRKVLIGRFYVDMTQPVYTPEFLDPLKTDIQGIPIPKDKQRKAIETMKELKTEFGGKLPPAIRRYEKRAQPLKNRSNINEDLKEAHDNELNNQRLAPPMLFTLSDVQRSTRNRFGAFYLYQSIAEQIGLLPILMESFPGDWRKLFTLACFLVTTGDPMCYCERWLEKTEAFPVSLSSPSISKLLSSLEFNEIGKFYERWINHRREKEFLALDITSVSSYSKLSPDVGYGYNREKDKLPQINMCLLFGEESQLPFFIKTYHGKLRDVSTLKSTLAEIFSLVGNDLTLVMDKGFASEENINCLTAGPMRNNFLMALSFKMDLAKQQPKTFRDSMRAPSNIMPMAQKTWGLTTMSCLNNGVEVFTHVIYNADKAVSDEYEIQAEIKKVLDLAIENPDDVRYQKDFRQWLNITRNEDKTVQSIEINQKSLDRALANSGWLVIISNCVDKAEKALSIYRSKDVVEKSFHRLKAQLDMRRLRIHCDSTMRSKVFVSFLSLVLVSHINNVMIDNKLYDKYTLKEVIDILETLHLIKIKNNTILEPLTSEQKNIFEIFSVDKPDILDIKT
jgi:hypothetical protein